MQMAASSELSLAIDCAHKVAPYEAPKLQTTAIQGDLQLNVTIRKF